MENFKVNYHSSVCLDGNIYIDPLNIEDEPRNAKAIFITHSHWDHLSFEDIKKVMNENTVFIAPEDCIRRLKEKGFEVKGKTDIKYKTFPSYNITKINPNKKTPYHLKSEDFVGYIIEINGFKYVFCGDTDFTPELAKIKCDVLFVPIGGTYTMTAEEAAECANVIKPKLVVPVHYLLKMKDSSELLGSRKDEKTFIKKLDNNIKYKVMI